MKQEVGINSARTDGPLSIFSPVLAPLHLPGVSIGDPVRPRDYFVANTICTAEPQGDPPVMFPRATKYPCARRVACASRRNQVAILLIFVGQRAPFEATMEARPVQANAKVAPVVLWKRTRLGMRTGRY